jgi:hypothetical protein
LTCHRKNLHGYQPKARRYLSGKAARLSAAAPYPSTQHKGDIPESLDSKPVFPDFAGLIPCDALSPAESSHSDIPQFQDKFDELTWEKFFPCKIFASVDEQPSRLPFPFPTPDSLQPPTVPVDFSTLHIPQIDPRLLSDDNSQPPIPTLNSFQPSTVPVDFLTHHIPQIDPKLLSDDNSQPPIPTFDGDLQWKSVAGNDLNNSLPAGVETFLLTYGSGSF